MRKTLLTAAALLMILPGLMMTVSCSKKTIKDDGAKTDAYGDSHVKDVLTGNPEGQPLEQGMVSRSGEYGPAAERNRFLNEHIYFAFDSAVLTARSQDILREKAAWLRRNPSASVIAEGHCDERGTTEYNLALGDRRANSVKRFLSNLGIAGSRITPISYGEERPIDPGHNEAAWAQNRRAQLVIK
jgi:peptidoglycan-associated lipoprotein